MGIPYTTNVKVIDAAGANKTSDAYDISKRQLVTVQFIAAGGTSVFSIDGSNDGTNWVTGIGFVDAATAGVPTAVLSKSVASTTALAYVPAGFSFIRVVAAWASGTASAILQAGG